MVTARILLSTGDVAKITGAHAQTVMKWCEKGLIEPVNSGMGEGHHRLFTIMDAVALAHVSQWTRLGAPLKLLRPVAALITGMTEQQLVDELAEGPRLVAPAGPDRAMLLAAEPVTATELSLEVAYRRVRSYVDTLLARARERAAETSRVGA